MTAKLDDKHRAVLIAGPTASGKSALALEIARRTGGAVVNADSMQLYDGLSIVTARPDAEDLAEAPHHLYGCIPPDRAYSTGEWVRAVAALLEELETDGRLPVIVGGTGLYFKALTEGFAEIPEIPQETRARCRQLAEDGGIEVVRAELAAGDPVAAESLADLQRLTRALEVVEATGRTLASWQEEGQADPVLPLDQTLPLVLAPPRPWLHARIEQRVRLMLDTGAIGEVEAFLARGLDPVLPAMRAIGVKETAALYRGDVPVEETIEAMTVATRQYAKRQETWFRNQMADWYRLDPAGETASEMAHRILEPPSS